ncbi:MAG: lipoprotein insertase outer membrane protein LolB, partial [Vicinamibacteria bacterium]
YQGLVRVRGRGPEGGFDARLAVIFERPRRLRVELLGPFGGTRWSAVADEEGITAYFPGRRHYLRESEVEEVVSRLLGIRLSSEEMMAALAGVGVPSGAAADAKGHRRGPKVFLDLDPASGRTVELDSDGQVIAARARDYRVSYPTSWKSRSRSIPDELVIQNESVRATLTSRDVDVNVGLDPEAFLLEIPEDAERLRPAEIEGEAVFVIGKEPP